MSKVYIVWYINTELGKTGIWGIYSTVEKAEDMIRIIREDFDYTAWWHEETVE